jgi:cell division protein FtsX
MQGQDGASKVELKTYLDSLVSRLRPALLALLVAVTILWLIACANVANLMLARGIARQRELAVRGALGAGRWRIIRQLFTESVLLASCGSLLGLGLAEIALRVFSKGLSSALNVPHNIAPDVTVILALLVLTVLSAAVFGLFPAWLDAEDVVRAAPRAARFPHRSCACGGTQTAGLQIPQRGREPDGLHASTRSHSPDSWRAGSKLLYGDAAAQQL